MKKTEIPPTSRNGSASRSSMRDNMVILRQILEKAAAGARTPSALIRRLATITRVHGREVSGAKGLDPLKPELERIAAAKTSCVDRCRARVQLRGPNPLFNFYSNSDLHNADMVIAYVDQGASVCRTHITSRRPKMVEMRKHLRLVTGVFYVVGPIGAAGVRCGANRVAIETALAKASMIALSGAIRRP